MNVTLMVDGSHCPDTGAGGFGYWVASSRGKAPGSGPITGRCANSTEVEMKGVCNALVYTMNAGLVEQGDVVLIQTDSKEAIAAFEHRRIPGQGGEKDAVSFLDRFKKERNLILQFRHVKGHSSKPGARYAANNHCDTRAKRAMRKVRAQLKEGKHVQTSGGTDSGRSEEGGLQDV